jgi:hypothetical protein
LHSFIPQWSLLHQNSKAQTDHKPTPSHHPTANHFKSVRRSERANTTFSTVCVVLYCVLMCWLWVQRHTKTPTSRSHIIIKSPSIYTRQNPVLRN